MFACDGIQSAIKYYRYFKGETFLQEVKGVKRELKIKSHNLKVACVFSVSENEFLQGDKVSSKEAIIEIINDYNEMFKHDINAPNYDYSTLREYRADVERRMKNRQIDLLIVSDMFLTGFDSKKLNTLYMDKEQKYHTLIQTLSRTNRIDDFKKNCGNINCYRNIKENVEEAIKLFSNENALEKVIPPTYAEQLQILNEAINQLQSSYPDVESIQNLKGDFEKKDFIEKMRNVNRLLNATKQYRDFTYDDIPVSKLTLQEFDAKYCEIFDEVVSPQSNGKVSILDGVDFEISLIERVIINYDYIKYFLLRGLENIKPDSDDYKSTLKQIFDKVEKDPKLRTKLELLKDFLDKYTGEQNIINDFDAYTENLNTLRLSEFCKEENISSEDFLVIRNQYMNGKTFIQLNDAMELLIKPDEGLNFLQRRHFISDKLDSMKSFLLDYHEEIVGSQ
jgi:type I restriction enzyme R subunit